MPKVRKKRKKKEEIVLTPAEKYEQLQNLYQGMRCILRKQDEYDIYLYLANGFSELAKTPEEDAFEELGECESLAEECRMKAEELKKELPAKVEVVSRTVTRTAKEREKDVKKGGAGKWIPLACIVLAIAFVVCYKVTPTRYIIAGWESSLGIHKYAMESFAKLKNYKDSSEKKQAERLLYVKELVEKENVKEARRQYELLAGVEDSEVDLALCRLELRLMETAKEGALVTFGKSEWIVLDKKDGKVLLTRDTVLRDDEKKGDKTSGWNRETFASKAEKVTWADSPLRQYLNQDFVSDQFTAVEKTCIEQTHLKNSANPQYRTDGGADTEDCVFIMSAEEIEPYLELLDKRAKGKSIRLRTPGMDQASTVYISNKNEIVYYGYPVEQTGIYNRPTIWVEPLS